MTEIICEFCDQPFIPLENDPDQRCPKCGAVHEKQDEEIASLLHDSSDLGSPHKPEKTIMEEIPVTSLKSKSNNEEQKEDTSEDRITGEEFFKQVTQNRIIYSPASQKRDDWRTYIPTIAVCGLFLLWTLIDQMARPREFEKVVTSCIEALDQGDTDMALKEADLALQLRPKSKLAKSLYDYVEKKSVSNRTR